MELKDLRNEIDGINDEMNALFGKRMRLCAEVADYKRANGLPITDSRREREIIHKAVSETDSELADATRVFFTELMNISRSYQASLMPVSGLLSEQIDKSLAAAPASFPHDAVVACQGSEGAYSQIACDKLFPSSEIIYFNRFENVFAAVEKGLCKYGILPIENSSYGSVSEVYDLMKKYDFHIVRALKLKIDHSLLAKAGATLADIKEIYSHEQAIGQCGAFLASHPEIKVHICENTAYAARLVAESGRSDIAAIASKSCASIYGLSEIAASIQGGGNYTRFICISHDMEIYDGSDRISLMLTLPHTPGSLSGLLTRFSSLGINLTKLESRPIHGCDFEFMFYFDVIASIREPSVKKLICGLSAECERFALLGCYSER